MTWTRLYRFRIECDASGCRKTLVIDAADSDDAMRIAARDHSWRIVSWLSDNRPAEIECDICANRGHW